MELVIDFGCSFFVDRDDLEFKNVFGGLKV